MTKVRATSSLKLASEKINITITYQKGATLKSVLSDLIPMAAQSYGKGDLKKFISETMQEIED